MEGIAVFSTQPETGGTSTVADGNSHSVTLSFTNQVFDADNHEALVLFPQVDINTAGTLDLEITVAGDPTPVYRARHDTPGTEFLEFPVYCIAALLRAIVGVSGEVSQATLTVTNRSGGSRDITPRLSGWVQA